MRHSPAELTRTLQSSIEAGGGPPPGLLHPERYKQHNPHVADGVAGIVAVHEMLPHDEVYANVVRAFQDGDYGFVHVDYHLFGPTVAFDVHRYEDGVSVEHWDNLQDTPPGRNPAGRTMTDGKTQVRDHDKTEANKTLALRFTEQVLVGQQEETAGDYFDGDRLLQHDPHMADGLTAFVTTRRTWREQGTPARYDRVHLVLGEGNFVLVMSEGEFLGEHSAFYDLYRIEGDVLVEHWDVVQTIPPLVEHQNRNGKF